MNTTGVFLGSQSISPYTFLRNENNLTSQYLNGTLTSANFLDATVLGSYAFAGFPNLYAVNLPNVRLIHQSAFRGCSSLSIVNIPNASYIENFAFYSCSKLQVLSFPKLASLSSFYTFAGCVNLISFNLVGVSSVPVLYSGASYLFSFTPIGGYSDIAGQYGSIYVPSSLYGNFYWASGWSLYRERLVSV